MKTLTVLASALALAACQSAPQQPSGQMSEELRATAALQPTKGNKALGEVTFEQQGDRVRVLANVQGLKPGAEHGFHIHEAGDCSADDGSSAKGHFNPDAKPHGNPAAADHHAGDLPALKAGKDGRAKLDTTISGVTLAPGPTSIVGRGMVIHADPDDYKTQPAGNSGARIACGVIKPS
jgi:superoxide dismutase, Cu-Zn family